MEKTAKIVLLGGAGLVGQNLIILLKSRGYKHLCIVDKHAANLSILIGLHPDVVAILADLAESGWEECMKGAAAVVMLQAQIGGEKQEDFTRNNVHSTRLALEACKANKIPYLVHISSSVVKSRVKDNYTESKKEQERMVLESGIPCSVLRPTLMFGWFDRKHLGWLARFMRRVPLFPIPGSGRYMRQPLYVVDFCRIIIACIERRGETAIYNITGSERIDYIDIIRAIRHAIHAKVVFVHIPYRIFWWLLKIYAVFNRDPPFTTSQLEALVTPEEFELIRWWEIFGVRPTPFVEAINETFGAGPYRDVALEF